MNQANIKSVFLVLLSCFLLLSILSSNEVVRLFFQLHQRSHFLRFPNPVQKSHLHCQKVQKQVFGSWFFFSRGIGGISLFSGRGVDFSLCFPSCNRFEKRDSFVTLLFSLIPSLIFFSSAMVLPVKPNFDFPTCSWDHVLLW